MKSMPTPAPVNSENHPVQIVSVRGRPVGISRSGFGAALIAIERGYFPVSHTGYWSMAGYGAGQAGPLTIKPELLESQAEAQDRERRALLINLHRAVKPERDRRGNFIHVSLYVDKAINDAFFAPDHERAPLWQAAHRLLCLVDSDPQFQPTPDHYAWTSRQCEQALGNMRRLHECLKRFAQGDYSGIIPMPLFGAKAYVRLPPKSSGEPVVALHETAVELSFDLKIGMKPRRMPERTTPQIVRRADETIQQPVQLGLFAGNATTTSPVPRVSV